MAGDRRGEEEITILLAVMNIKLEESLANQAVLQLKIAEMQTTFDQAQGAIKFVKWSAAAVIFAITVYEFFLKNFFGGK